jgi:hypothetical protein
LIFAKPPRLNLIGTDHRCPPFAHPRPLSADQARRARTTTSWRLRAAAIAELSWLSCDVLVASYEPPRRDSSDAGATNARASKGIASVPARTRRALGCSRQTRPVAYGLKRWLGEGLARVFPLAGEAEHCSEAHRDHRPRSEFGNGSRPSPVVMLDRRLLYSSRWSSAMRPGEG